MKHKRLAQIFLATAMSFLVLGVGNFIYGSVKLSEYSQLLKNANEELAETELKNASKAPSQPSRNLKLLTRLNVDQQTQHISKLKTRVDFYAFVARGGKCFLALSALALLGFLLSLGLGSEASPADEETKANPLGT